MNITPLFLDADAEKRGDRFTARVAMNVGLRDATIDKTTEKLLLSRIESIDLRRVGENWKIVPRPVPLPVETTPVAGDEDKNYQEWEIRDAEAQVRAAREENDGIINDWARLMTKSPGEMRQQLTQLSLSNVRQLSLGMLMVVQDYDETYHFDADNWQELFLPYVQNKNLFEMPVLDAEKDSTYSINPALFGKNIAQIAQVTRTVAIYEAGIGAGGLNYQHGGHAIVGFADGHAELIAPEDLPKLIWDIRPNPSG